MRAVRVRAVRGSWLSMAIAGMILISFGFSIMSITKEIRQKEERCSQVTTGTVTSVTAKKRTTGRKKNKTTYYVYATRYTFTVDGMQVNGETNLSKNARLEEGDEITVHYDPDQPTENYGGNKDEIPSFIPATFFGLGGFMLLIGLIQRRRQRR